MISQVRYLPKDTPNGIEKLREMIKKSDCIMIGAAAGLSTSAGFLYAGDRFEKYFSDFIEVYGFEDMYSAGFYNFPTDEIKWAYWSRYIWINRYVKIPKPKVFNDLLKIVENKDYFVLTTNVDHTFQKSGFDKKKLFYTQGDYGLLQCSKPCCNLTWDNEEIMRAMLISQGFEIAEDNSLIIPNNADIKMEIPSDLIPTCPKCGRQMSTNLRADATFVEDSGWNEACERYNNFLEKHENGKILYLELGVGFNTPSIIKYNFWQRTDDNPNAMYACINYREAFCPDEIANRSVTINADIGASLCSAVRN